MSNKMIALSLALALLILGASSYAFYTYGNSKGFLVGYQFGMQVCEELRKPKQEVAK